MQHLTKEKGLLVFVVASLIFCVLVLLATTNTITNVSAVEAKEVGVYWDINCNNRVSSIDWGTLELGSSKNIIVYIRNEVDEPHFLCVSTMNWNPSEASDYITLGWDYAGQRIDIGEVLQIKLTLYVSRYIEGISNFSFDILIAGSKNFPGDANGDGHVRYEDLSLLTSHWYGHLGYGLGYNPAVDFNMDGKIDYIDLGILASNWYRGPLD